MSTKSSVTTLGYITLAITALAISGVIFFILHFKSLIEYMGIEVFKLSYQFLLIVVIGGAISLLFTLYTKEREKKEKLKEKEQTKKDEEKTLQRKFYSDFIQAYNEVKKIRRFLRARGRILSIGETKDKSILIKTKIYDDLMKDLTVIQLKFEFFCDEVHSNPTLFSDNNENLLSSLSNTNSKSISRNFVYGLRCQNHPDHRRVATA